MPFLGPLVSAIPIEVRARGAQPGDPSGWASGPGSPRGRRDRVKRGLLGRLAAYLIPGFRRRRVSADDLRSAEFRTSTQGLGVRFTDRIRDTFRFKWLKRR